MTRHSRTLTAAAMGLLAVALASCSSATSTTSETRAGTGGYPVTVSSCGVDYSYSEAPERVLLGAPGMVNTLDALGVADSAIGYTLSDYAAGETTTFPWLSLTTKDYTPSREFLISAQPDLFLSNDEQQLLGDGSASKDDLAAIPANLYVLGGYCADAPARSGIDVVYDDITNLGSIYGVPQAASDLITGLTARVSDAAALIPTAKGLSAGAVTIYDGKVYALGGSYYAAVISSLGLTNGFGDLGSNWSEITPEAVLASDLDVILVTYSGGDDTQAVSDARALFANSPAATNDRIVGISDTAFQSVGVAIIDVIEETARQLATR